MIPETEPDQMSHWKGEEMLLCVFAGNVNGSVPERNIRFSFDWTVHNRVERAAHG